MDTKQFAKLLQAIVRKEMTEIVRKEMKSLKTEILREIKTSSKRTVVKKQGFTEDDIDNLVAAKLAEMRGNKAPSKKQKPVKRKPPLEKYSNDNSLNSILQETALYSDFTDHDDGRGGWRTVNGGNAYDTKDAIAKSFRSGHDIEMPDVFEDSPHYNSGHVSVDEMLPDKDTRGMQSRINADSLPDSLKHALTRDYSNLMNVMDKDIKKKKKQRGLLDEDGYTT